MALVSVNSYEPCTIGSESFVLLLPSILCSSYSVSAFSLGGFPEVCRERLDEDNPLRTIYFMLHFSVCISVFVRVCVCVCTLFCILMTWDHIGISDNQESRVEKAKEPCLKGFD